MLLTLCLPLLLVVQVVHSPAPSRPHIMNNTSSTNLAASSSYSLLISATNTTNPHTQSVVPLTESFRPSFAVIIGILSAMFSLTFLILLYAKHCRTMPASMYGLEEVGTPITHNDHEHDMISILFGDRYSGLDKSVVEALPSFLFSTLKGTKEGMECAVCLSSFKNHEVLRLLPKCKHAFHLQCLDTWLENHSTCPLCRHRVDPHDTQLLWSEDSYFSFRKLGASGYHSMVPSEHSSMRRNSARMCVWSEYNTRQEQHGQQSSMRRSSARISTSIEHNNHQQARNATAICGEYSNQRHQQQPTSNSFQHEATLLEFFVQRDLEPADAPPSDWLHPSNSKGSMSSSWWKNDNGSALARNVSEQLDTLVEDGVTHADTDRTLTKIIEDVHKPEDKHGCMESCYSDDMMRRFGHQIIVSHVLLQHRWSDFIPSDVTALYDINGDGSVLLMPSQDLQNTRSGKDCPSHEEQGTEGDYDPPSSVSTGSNRMTRASNSATSQTSVLINDTNKKKSLECVNHNCPTKADSSMRSMSELSGLARVQQVDSTRNCKEMLVRVSEELRNAQDESAKQWFISTRRTLKWILGSSSSLSLLIPSTRIPTASKSAPSPHALP